MQAQATKFLKILCISICLWILVLPDRVWSDSNDFAVNNRLAKNVEFWVKVYSKYSTSAGLIHDAKYVDHIYEIFNFNSASSVDYKLVHQEKVRWKSVLLSLHKKSKNPNAILTEDEKRVFELYKDVNEPDKFLKAAHRKRIRFQLGQSDRFLNGIVQSGEYLPYMEAVFKREELPVELTRLPFVESSFNVYARSKVGASGIWQFMRSTGRLFLRIDEAVDERNDPIRATEAAAKLLKLNYASLQHWPLAVTAYNHGRKGMMRAIRKVGSEELEDVISDYRTRSFGFASSNFFSEFLAAIEVERNSEKYFGEIPKRKLLKFVEMTIPDYIDLKVLVRGLGLQFNAVKEYNPALTDSVLNGALMVPKGYQLRIPLNTKSDIKDEAAMLASYKAMYANILSTDKKEIQSTGMTPGKKIKRRIKRIKKHQHHHGHHASSVAKKHY